MEHIVRGRGTIGDALVIGEQPVSVGPLLIERIEK
jgi:hypothetical protein